MADVVNRVELARRDQRGKTASGRSVITERGYVATRLGLESFEKQLYAEALQRGLTKARSVLVLADGAVWIWLRFTATATGIGSFPTTSRRNERVSPFRYPAPTLTSTPSLRQNPVMHGTSPPIQRPKPALRAFP